jgi:hypothetical protein
MNSRIRFGLVKSGLDAHTLGISSLSQLLEECGFPVLIADKAVTEALDRISEPRYFQIFRDWLVRNRLNHLGFSYRLDPRQALDLFSRMVHYLKEGDLYSPDMQSQIKEIYFAGLPEACDLVTKTFQGKFPVFRGDETVVETLERLGVPEKLIPRSIRENYVYDDMRLTFGKALIQRERYLTIRPSPSDPYSDFGTKKDNLIKRLASARKRGCLPLTRVHAGPYLSDRERALALFSDWLKRLAKTQYLDIVSVGSSQLSQSMFGEDWGDRSNGGGVPFNNEFELQAIREDSSPMLVRAYSATKNIPYMAKILERNLNMAWHALSLWWFNQIDGRGPLSVRQSLSEHMEALKYIASVGKPFEPNLPHHFAFRGSDDVSYVVSAYLAAQVAKQLGIKHLVLQNMLNTPKFTSGVRDLVKARVLLKLVRSLEEKSFRVIYQPRAGLDYFSPDLEKAKIQLTAVTALMADVEMENPESPEIIHVVSYSEAMFLANPDIINESIQITRAALQYYPEFRQRNAVNNILSSKELETASIELETESRMLIADMEKSIPDLYTAPGLYDVFRMGYFPVPYLWEGRDEFANAVNWTTKIFSGGVHLADDRGNKLSVRDRIMKIKERNSAMPPQS